MTLEAVRTVTQCRGTRVDGRRCESEIIGRSGFCFAHDPDREEARARARRCGSRASSKLHRARRLAPPVLVEVYDELEKALDEVHRGDLSPHRAQAMAALARAMVTVLTAGEREEDLRGQEAEHTEVEVALDRALEALRGWSRR